MSRLTPFSRILVIFLLVVLVGGCGGCISSLFKSEGEITVSKASSLPYGDSYRYLIYDENTNTTYQVDKCFICGKFEASQTFMSMKEGHKYKCQLRGLGKSFFTDYKNIVSAVEIKAPPPDSTQIH